MSQDISIILVFELTTILKGRAKDWSKYKQIGDCYLPQVVLEELEFLTKRAVLPEEEKTAREFMRFFPESNWHINDGVTSSPDLQLPQGENLSKNARLQLAIAQSVYHLSINHPKQLVILVTNRSNLRDQLEKIAANNLLSLTLAQFNQWLRQEQEPTIVSQAIANLVDDDNIVITPSPPSNSRMTTQGRVEQNTSHSSKKLIKRKPYRKMNISSVITSGIFTIGGLIIFALLGWFLIDPQSFQEFWDQTELSFPKN